MEKWRIYTALFTQRCRFTYTIVLPGIICWFMVCPDTAFACMSKETFRSQMVGLSFWLLASLLSLAAIWGAIRSNVKKRVGWYKAFLSHQWISFSLLLVYSFAENGITASRSSKEPLFFSVFGIAFFWSMAGIIVVLLLGRLAFVKPLDRKADYAQVLAFLGQFLMFGFFTGKSLLC